LVLAVVVVESGIRLVDRGVVPLIAHAELVAPDEHNDSFAPVEVHNQANADFDVVRVTEPPELVAAGLSDAFEERGALGSGYCLHLRKEEEKRVDSVESESCNAPVGFVRVVGLGVSSDGSEPSCKASSASDDHASIIISE
jgi:hypothetical protein